MPQNHGVSTAPKQTKAQRQAEQRAAQLEAFKKRQAAEKRGRVLTIVLSILAAVAVIAIVVVVIVVNIQPKPSTAALGEVETFPNLEQTHVTGMKNVVAAVCKHDALAVPLPPAALGSQLVS